MLQKYFEIIITNILRACGPKSFCNVILLFAPFQFFVVVDLLRLSMVCTIFNNETTIKTLFSDFSWSTIFQLLHYHTSPLFGSSASNSVSLGSIFVYFSSLKRKKQTHTRFDFLYVHIKYIGITY